jgi:hypothetical protein
VTSGARKKSTLKAKKYLRKFLKKGGFAPLLGASLPNFNKYLI